MINLDIYEKEKVKKGESKGCPVCNSKKTGKWGTEGIMGTTDYLYYCLDCEVTRVSL